MRDLVWVQTVEKVISKWHEQTKSITCDLEDYKRASACDFQHCGILTCVDSGEPLQPPFKIRNSKWCSISSFTLNIQATSKGSDQSAHMRRLVWAFAGRTFQIVGNLMPRLRASAWDFQQCGSLTCVDSDEPLQPPVKLSNSKWCSVSSLTIMEYSSD